MHLTELILQQMSSVEKPQRKFMSILLTTLTYLPGRMNFRNLGRYSSLNEKTFSRWFRRSFDFVTFHFLQATEEIHGELLSHSTYFKSLKSSRRASMLEAIERQSYKIHCEHLTFYGIDYLKSFSELDEYAVETADGHFIDHQNSHSRRPEKNLYAYDKAVTNFPWWTKQKGHQNYMISVLKENSVATWVESIAIDGSNPINTGIEGYSIYENQGVKFNVVHYRDPETQKQYRFVTTLPKLMSPGIIAILYYKCWTIQKAYNNSKSNLKEKKAWSSSIKSLSNQMRPTAMTYNLMRVCEEISKIQKPTRIPSIG
ncbi:hypothetical protein [Methylobacter sp. S3L5C]|uniref:hypothetical protein n=1 Tax=Methylobacter sp. S3L5C TaxID=2839024 RepID=UPI001FAD30FA|nr:hypothetical protein [Methylobacter sp. S3L5C]UOA08566.1 hypothetical protein KKZ03_20635 [Methylobacter sp. S3L5C]